MASCTISIGYGLKHTRFTFYFNSESTGDVFHIPRVPLNKYSILVMELEYLYDNLLLNSEIHIE